MNGVKKNRACEECDGLMISDFDNKYKFECLKCRNVYIDSDLINSDMEEMREAETHYQSEFYSLESDMEDTGNELASANEKLKNFISDLKLTAKQKEKIEDIIKDFEYCRNELF